MLTEERRIALVEQARKVGRVDVVNAAKTFSVAVETIRRDLDVLQRRGLMRRVHGGAIAMDRFTREFSVAERRGIQYEQKMKIAEVASKYIPMSGSIFLDAGTTIECLNPYLRDRKDLTVITNCIVSALQIGDSSTNVILLSGKLRPLTLSAVGELALSAMEDFHVDISFLGTNGVDPIIGFTTPDPDEAAVKRKMISHSKETIMIADSTKFGQSYAARFAQIHDIDRLITDVNVDQSSIAIIEKSDVEVVLA